MTSQDNPPQEPSAEAAKWLAEAGLSIDEPSLDGRIHRAHHACGGKAGDKPGWYIADAYPVPHGVCGCWRCGLHQRWTDGSRTLTDAELKAIQEKAVARDREIEEDQEKAAKKLRGHIAPLSPAPPDHAYLRKKGISAHGALIHPAGHLLLPLKDASGLVMSCQAISASPVPEFGDRTKSFERGCKTKGCFFVIGNIEGADLIVVCEGFATGASIFQATGLPAVCAMSAGNLADVAAVITEKYPDAVLVIAADNDRHTEGNPGLTKATAAARKYNTQLAVPDFGETPEGSDATDFNDLARIHGVAAVRRQIEDRSTPGTIRNRHGKFDVTLPDDFGQEMPTFVDQLGDALHDSNIGRGMPRYIRRSDSLAFVVGRGKETKIVPATESLVRTEVQRDVTLIKRRKSEGGKIFVIKAGEVPKLIARDVACVPSVCRRLPEVVGITGCPLISRHGEVTASGYCADQRLLLATDTWNIEEMDIATARDEILGLIEDFEFLTEIDESRAIASLFQPALVLGGAVERGPVLLVTAAERATGKGTLVRMRSAIYGTRPSVIVIRDGGVGGLDEDLSSALIDGGTFISIDNARGRIASQLLEAALTEDVVRCRKPYRASIECETSKVQWSMTSNGVELTEDLAARCCIVRLRKRGAGYAFKTKQPLAEATANRGRVLSAIFAIIKDWIAQGSLPAENDWNDHHRQFWSIVDWIVPEYFGLPKPTSGAAEAATTSTDPLLELFRGVGIELAKRQAELPARYQTIAILRMASEAGLQFNGKAIPTEDEDIESMAKSVGWRSKAVFTGRTSVEVEGFTVTKSVDGDERDKTSRVIYTFSPTPKPVSAPFHPFRETPIEDPPLPGKFTQKGGKGGKPVLDSEQAETLHLQGVGGGNGLAALPKPPAIPSSTSDAPPDDETFFVPVPGFERSIINPPNP